MVSDPFRSINERMIALHNFPGLPQNPALTEGFHEMVPRSGTSAFVFIPQGNPRFPRHAAP